MSWVLIAKPTRGAAPDGFLADDTFTPQTDGATTDPLQPGASTSIGASGADTDPGGTPDGFYAREHTDGFFTTDGDWTPVLFGLASWTAMSKPSSEIPVPGAYTDPDQSGAVTDVVESGALTGVSDGWVPVMVFD